MLNGNGEGRQVGKWRNFQQPDPSRFIGVVTDISTDSSVKEEEMVYIRTCVAGTVETFVGMTAVEKADAVNISCAVKGIMELVCRDWEEMVVTFSTAVQQ